MREIKSHTALRGIAALLVVIFHFRTTLTPVIDLDAYTHFFEKGYLWVDCFFMLSGFILCYVYSTRPGNTFDEAKRFLSARFARIYPLHIATLMALLAFETILPIVSKHAVHIGSQWTFWLNVFDIHAWGFRDTFDWNFPSWSISVEFAAYLIFPLICLALNRQRSITLYVLSAVAFAGLFFFHDNREGKGPPPRVPMFLAGIVMFYARSRIKESILAWVQIPLAIFLLIAFSFGFSDWAIDICFAGIVVSISFDSGPSRVLNSRPLLALGNWSYSIYMLHIPVRFVVTMIVGNRIGVAPIFCLLLAATILCGAASYRWFEMPMRNILKSKSLRPTSAFAH